MKYWFYVLLATALLGASAVAGQVEDLKTPVENSPDVVALIEQGISLHDARLYDEAIAKYMEAVKLNPDNPIAYYELAFSYIALQKYEAARECAEKAAEFDSGALASAYVLMGNIADMLDRPDEAIAVYDKGLSLQPDNYLLLYNKGYLYTRLNESMYAIDCYKKAMRSNPDHPSSHAALAQEYQRQHYRIPSILAYCRFFALEPNTHRTTQLMPEFQCLLTQGVEKQSDSVITVNVSMDGPDFDGDFSAVNLMLALSGASRHIDENEKKPPIELIYEDLNIIFGMMGDTDSGKERPGFVWEYYVPYFGEMYNNEYVRPFVYYIFQMSGDPVIQSWLTTHEHEVNEFLTWSSSYDFKSP